VVIFREIATQNRFPSFAWNDKSKSAQFVIARNEVTW